MYFFFALILEHLGFECVSARACFEMASLTSTPYSSFWISAVALTFDAVCVGINALFIWHLDSALGDTCQAIECINTTLNESAPPSSGEDHVTTGPSSLLDNPISYARHHLLSVRAYMSAAQTYIRLGSIALFHSQCACLCMLGFKYFAHPHLCVPGSIEAYSWWIRSTSACIYACTSFGILFCLKNGVREVCRHCSNAGMISSVSSILEIAIPFVKAAWFGFSCSGGRGANDGEDSESSSFAGSDSGVGRAARGFMDFLSMNAVSPSESDFQEDESDSDGDNSDDIANHSRRLRRRYNNRATNEMPTNDDGGGRRRTYGGGVGLDDDDDEDEWTDDDADVGSTTNN